MRDGLIRKHGVGIFLSRPDVAHTPNVIPPVLPMDTCGEHVPHKRLSALSMDNTVNKESVDKAPGGHHLMIRRRLQGGARPR